METRALLVQLVQVAMHALKKVCLREIFTSVQPVTSAQQVPTALNPKEFQGFLLMIRFSATRLIT